MRSLESGHWVSSGDTSIHTGMLPINTPVIWGHFTPLSPHIHLPPRACHAVNEFVALKTLPSLSLS